MTGSRAPLFYTGPSLDRCAQRRRDPDWIAARLAEPGTLVVPVWRGNCLVSAEAGGHRAAFLSVGSALALGAPPASMPLLGLSTGEGTGGVPGGAAIFAADLSALEDPASLPELSAAGGFEDLRAAGPTLPLAEGALLAYAKGLLWWHIRHGFCGVCGSPTESAEAGHVRRCADAACATQHFPRTDPAVIMLVHDGDRVLLGRQSRFPPGMYSTLAGFVEPGESLEEAVAREVREEAGVEVEEVRYLASQPWPFPSSLMLGFFARAATTEIRVDSDELEDARWFGREELLAAGEGDAFRLPRRDSIARRLVETWLGRA
jgi:NAD+ diphosphatase